MLSYPLLYRLKQCIECVIILYENTFYFFLLHAAINSMVSFALPTKGGVGTVSLFALNVRIRSPNPRIPHSKSEETDKKHRKISKKI